MNDDLARLEMLLNLEEKLRGHPQWRKMYERVHKEIGNIVEGKLAPVETIRPSSPTVIKRRA